MRVKARAVSTFLVLGHPLAFGAYFCLAGMLSGTRGVAPSLVAELLAGVACAFLLHRSLVGLAQLRYGPADSAERPLVLAAGLLAIAALLINISNADTSGLLAKGSRLSLYFENDWFRRLVTFSYMPTVLATYYSINAMLGPQYRHRRAVFGAFLLVLAASSLASGSKGAAVLNVAAALPFVFTVQRFPLARIGMLLALATAAYVTVFLTFTSQSTLSLLSLVLRFYQSIDMSLLLMSGQGTAQIISGQLGDVWLEVFRSVGSLGVRVADQPIGAMIFQYVMDTGPALGSNLRYGSLLLLYPDRLDFLLLFPLLVTAMAILLGEILKRMGLARAALVAVPWFAFQSFQDGYWFAAHVIPIVGMFGFLQLAKAVGRGPVRSTPDPA